MIEQVKEKIKSREIRIYIFCESRIVHDIMVSEICMQVINKFSIRYYLPTPPLGLDMTQGQILSGV